MKVLGISCGRKLSNTEVLVKEALMGAEEEGAQVEILRLLDFNLKPCTGCNSCVIDLLQRSGSGACVVDDEFKLIDEKIMECDGLILGTPIYEKSPTGYLKLLNDRMGPSHDLAMRLIAKEARQAKGITKGKAVDERSFKPRVAALFGIGGSDWTELTLPLMQLVTMPMDMKVVDQHVFNWIALPGVAVLHEDMLTRARESGRHVARSLKDPGTATYIGDPGICPVCHTKLLEMNGTTSVGCATCGIKGKLKIEGERVCFEVSPEAMKRSIVTLEGKFLHVEDMKNRSLKPHPNMHEIPQRLEKYRRYLSYYRPERK